MDDVEKMPERLAAWLTGRDGSRAAAVTSYEPIVGGYSRLMARATVEWSDGATERVVLRGDPPPGKAMIDTDRDVEWALLQTLERVVPMPSARGYDAVGDALGTKCIVLDQVDGPSLQAVLVGSGGDADHARHADDLIDTLAAVHAIEPPAVAGALEVPTDGDDYLGALIDRFRQADAGHVEAVPFLRYVAAWLDSHRPPPLPLRLVHGDFQPSNVVIAPDGGHRLIDWELAHVGDPREDLGYYDAYAAALGPNLYAADRQRFLARYRERTGFDEAAVNVATVGYFAALAAITVYGQVLAGAGAMALGANHGLMTTYTINALTVGHGNFLAACSPPDAAVPEQVTAC